MLVILARDVGAGDCRELEASLGYCDTCAKKQNKTKSKPKAKRQYVFLCETGFLYADLASPDYVDQDRLKLMKSTCFYLPSAGLKTCATTPGCEASLVTDTHDLQSLETCLLA